MKNQFVKVLLAVVFVGLGASVQATPITGTVSFNAKSATLNNSFAAGTETKFLSINSATVAARTTSGSYAALTGGQAATFSTFTFVPETPFTTVDPLWTVKSGGLIYTFVATSETTLIRGLDFLDIGGEGYASITTSTGHEYHGYAPTLGLWSITDTKTGISSITFSSASKSLSILVPDGGLTASLLGMGLIGCALVARKAVKLA
jgi:hypothetical protein